MTSARSLRDALRRLLVASRALDPNERPCGTPMSLPHAHALLTLLSSAGPLSIAELASSLHIDRTNVSRLCARMEALGEVERRPDPNDRRSVRVRLSPSGHLLATHIDTRSAAHFSNILDAMGPDSAGVLDALIHLTDALQHVESSPETTQ